MLNRVILIGRLTKDPELRYTPSSQAVATFTLAVDRGYQNQQGQKETDFINIVTWAKQAETVAQYVKKGRLVAVEGRIQTRNYENNEGKKVYVTEVVAESVKFLESAKEGRQDSSSLPQEPITERVEGSIMDNSKTINVKDPFADDDLPFNKY
jgi:single-strand DNA-binding protein